MLTKYELDDPEGKRPWVFQPFNRIARLLFLKVLIKCLTMFFLEIARNL